MAAAGLGPRTQCHRGSDTSAPIGGSLLSCVLQVGFDYQPAVMDLHLEVLDDMRVAIVDLLHDTDGQHIAKPLLGLHFLPDQVLQRPTVPGVVSRQQSFHGNVPLTRATMMWTVMYPTARVMSMASQCLARKRILPPQCHGN